jgi:hypothetical protein
MLHGWSMTSVIKIPNLKTLGIQKQVAWKFGVQVSYRTTKRPKNTLKRPLNDLSLQCSRRWAATLKRSALSRSLALARALSPSLLLPFLSAASLYLALHSYL